MFDPENSDLSKPVSFLCGNKCLHFFTRLISSRNLDAAVFIGKRNDQTLRNHFFVLFRQILFLFRPGFITLRRSLVFPALFFLRRSFRSGHLPFSRFFFSFLCIFRLRVSRFGCIFFFRCISLCRSVFLCFIRSGIRTDLFRMIRTCSYKQCFCRNSLLCSLSFTGKIS